MTQQAYLLELEESSGGNEFITQHLIKAENAQMVKYHYHRTLKDMGWTNTQFGKHVLEGPRGMFAEIISIKPLRQGTEYDILEKYIRNWTKV